MSDAYIDEMLSEIKVQTSPMLVTVDVISAENSVVSDDVIVMASTIDADVSINSTGVEIAADGAFNVVTINHGGAHYASYLISNNQFLTTIMANALIQRVFVNVTEAFDNAEMTIGDDDAQGRLVAVNDVNLSKVGMYEIVTYLQYDQQREAKIYFNKVNTVGKLNVIIIIG